MADVRADWAERIRFDVQQAELSAVTGDYSYFNTSIAQYYSNGVDTVQGQNVDPAVKKQLCDIDIAAAGKIKTAMQTLENNIKATKVDDHLPDNAKKEAWKARILEQNDKAINYVTGEMKAAADNAISLIDTLPAGAKDAASDIYTKGFALVQQAVQWFVTQVKKLFNYIADFIQKIWNGLVAIYDIVSTYIGGTVNGLLKFFGFGSRKLALATGISNGDNLDASQATQSLLSLVYSFRVPHDEIVASTNRIWDDYQAQYSEATTEQEPRNVTVSRKPKPEGDRDTDGKLMFISWQTDGNTGFGNSSELIESVCRSEQKALAGSYSGGLRYNIVDMGNHPNATQQKQSVGSKEGIELQSRRHEVRY